MASLGVDPSFSRPHVSDDNPFSKAGFKTIEYQPDYPGFFAGLLHARGRLSTLQSAASVPSSGSKGLYASSGVTSFGVDSLISKA